MKQTPNDLIKLLDIIVSVGTQNNWLKATQLAHIQMIRGQLVRHQVKLDTCRT